VAVIAPLVALSVPIFDTLSVVWIRASRGESIMKGDKRHFSHRLVKLGMTPLQAVSFIFLVAAVSGLGAILLRQLDAWGTVLVIAQVVGLYCLIAILMRTRLDGNAEGDW
jgi:UDP-GlcNAc:undecaprenyl-phosphate GlcNAc-1-phosphate transferase